MVVSPSKQCHSPCVLTLRVWTKSQNPNDGVDTRFKSSRCDCFAGNRRLVHPLLSPVELLIIVTTTTHPHYKGAFSFIHLPHPHVSHTYQFISKFTEVVDKRPMFASIYSVITKHSYTVQTEKIRNVKHSMLCELGEDQQTIAMTGEIGSEQRRTTRPVVLHRSVEHPDARHPLQEHSRSQAFFPTAPSSSCSWQSNPVWSRSIR